MRKLIFAAVALSLAVSSPSAISSAETVAPSRAAVALLRLPSAPLRFTRISDRRLADESCYDNAHRACQPQYDACMQSSGDANRCGQQDSTCIQSKMEEGDC